MSNYTKFENTIVFHPGYYINEYIKEMKITKMRLSKQLDISLENIKLIIKGEKHLTLDIVKKLSNITETTEIYWLNLQKEYNKIKHKREH